MFAAWAGLALAPHAAAAAETVLVRVRAELASLELTLGIHELDRRAEVAALGAEYEEARLRAAADKRLSEEGLLGEIQRRVSEGRARTLEERHELAKRRLELSIQANAAQLEVKQAARLHSTTGRGTSASWPTLSSVPC